MSDFRAANKDVRQLLKLLDSLGCVISRTGSGHWRVSRQGCPSVTVVNSPSDVRALKNVRAEVKRNLGIII